MQCTPPGVATSRSTERVEATAEGSSTSRDRQCERQLRGRAGAEELQERAQDELADHLDTFPPEIAGLVAIVEGAQPGAHGLARHIRDRVVELVLDVCQYLFERPTSREGGQEGGTHAGRRNQNGSGTKDHQRKGDALPPAMQGMVFRQVPGRGKGANKSAVSE